ncbi:SMI1/KNR4 family protein [Paenibacillus sp. N3/727]|uniref:SMI1/KNR4 family protein n=1 Tax=Paenibacillus sp. N3/727 TaxID=2925845 RepID=UPI001F531F03|nr:SMI1/KNR4 family protein [Paenibacillus sp. N3/727]UNK16296.1 SMI1/KNR4 family protein [Paenibacillus sp. N3/727]
MWTIRFEHEFIKYPGVTEEQITCFLTTWNKDLSEQEINEIKKRQVNPFPKSSPYYDQYKPFDPTGWKLPQRAFPDSYIDFMKYSNGGEFQNGERCFQFFDTEIFREMNFAYEMPEYMPFAVSFAMDGSGNHYLFDMREAARNNEYPILIAHSGNLGYEDCTLAASSFMELCTERWELW